MRIESRIEQYRAEQQERARGKLAEYLERYPTEHPHSLVLKLDSGIMLDIKCPGHEHCGLWYGGVCGVAVEAAEVGSEFLEWQVGPEFSLTRLPVQIGFTWTGGGEDDPPEIVWWPLPDQGSSP
jgi:hypothetical protein